MPGRPPKHPSQRVRRNVKHLLELPAEGRAGDPPDWPLTKALKAELAVWAQVWGTPQAVAWERLGWTRTVARYVRTLVRSEAKDAPQTILGEARQLEDKLGLTPMSMKRLEWWVVEPEVDETRSYAPTERRLAIVDPATVTGT